MPQSYLSEFRGHSYSLATQWNDFCVRRYYSQADPSDIEIWRVYTMNNVDRHQDHMAVYQASIVACRSIPQILGYETPSTWHSFMPQVLSQ